MTTINCASNCIHQYEGRCTLDHFSLSLLTSNSDCVYFEERNSNKKPVNNETSSLITP